MAQFAMPLSDQIDRYLLSLVTMRSPQTLAWYRKRLAPLRQLSEPVTLSDLQALYAALASRNVKYANHPSGRHAESGPLSPATLRGYVRSWRGFFNWLVDNGALPCSPARNLKLPQMPKQPPKSIARSDMELIIEAGLEGCALSRWIT